MITSIKNKHTQSRIVGVSLLLGLLAFTSIAQADDVQIYLVPPPDPIPPNVLFILDESGSMSSNSSSTGCSNPSFTDQTSCTANGFSWGVKTRNVALKHAMRAVIDDSDLSNVNAAIMGYTSGADKIRVMSDFMSMDTPANRTALKTAVNGLQTLSGTPTVDALGLGIEWFKSTGGWTHISQTYISPLNDDQKYCQKNSIVLLTDGQPNTNGTWDGLDQYPVNSTPAPNTPQLTCASDSASRNGNGQCAREMAKWVYDKDLRNWNGIQNVTTFTVSMITSSTAQTFMRSIACKGHGHNYYVDPTADPLVVNGICNGTQGVVDGETLTGAEKDAKIGYYLAGGEKALVDALKSAVQETQSSVEYSFNTPSIPLNPDNAAISAGYIYVPFFAPNVMDAWKGNLKKYKIGMDNDGNIEILDANNANAVESDFTFKTSAQSIWSAVPDGNNPLIGGAADKIFGGSRTIYTYLSDPDLTDGSNLVSDFDPAESSGFDNCSDVSIQSLFGVGTEGKCVEAVKWLTTGSVDTGEVDEDGKAIIDYKFGAPIHTKPIVINYAAKSIVYMPTSDGILHAFDADTGAELWGYIPAELLQDVLKVKTNADNNAHPIYGLDGDITVVHSDKNGNQRVDGGEEVLLVFGQRRGGNNYYALNVTNPESPQYQYQITGGTGTCSDISYTDKTRCEEESEIWTKTGTFGNLAQTWSKPVFFQIDDDSLGTCSDSQFTNRNSCRGKNITWNPYEAEALIFGGGYDATEDVISSVRVDDTIGNSIYIVHAWTGDLIQHISIPGMNNSIPANIAVIDVNANDAMERFYVGDMGGRIIRIDFEENDLTAGIVADVGGFDGNQNVKFFNEVTVAYESRGDADYIALVLGSGNRAEPLDKTVRDSFFMIKDRAVWSVPGICSDVNFINKAACLLNNKTWTTYYDKVLIDDLTDVTLNYKEGVDAELLASEGWRMDLPVGVKVFSKAAVYNYAVLFTAYSGDKLVSSDICRGDGAAGGSTFWAVGLLSAQAIFDDFDGDDTALSITDRSKALKVPGLPPSPTLLFPENPDGGVGGDAISIVGMEEATRWGQQFFELYWEEVIDY